MGKKKTLDELKGEYKKHNCELLSTEYKNQEDILKFRCSCGQIDQKTHRQFHRTPKCKFSNHKDLIDGKIKLNENTKSFYKRWTIERLIYEGNRIHGEGKISYKHVSEAPVHKTAFKLECLVCSYIWYTDLATFITNPEPKGCGWCKDQLANIKNFTLYIVDFIGTRIHKNRYTYELVDGKIITSSDCEVKVCCRKIGHSFIIQKVRDHLHKTKKRCCLLCEEKRLKKRIKIGPKPWDLDRVIRKSNKIHGEGKYDYSNTNDYDIENTTSNLKIVCLNKKRDGSLCGNIFEKTIMSHLYNRCGCPDCFIKRARTLKSFLEAANQIYKNGEFLYHLIKEEDIVNSDSRPPIICSKCQEILDFSINVFLNSGGVQCGRCFGIRKWTPERLKEECEIKSKEGIYDYGLVEYDEAKNHQSIIKIICKKCKENGFSYIFTPTINNHFNNGSGCPRCSSNMPWTYARLISDIPKQFIGEYDYSLIKDEPVDKNSMVPIIHNKCGNIFNMTINYHWIHLHGCNFCTLSHGAKIIYTYLKNKNIYFEMETICPGLTKEYPYRYDFEFQYNNRTVIIEYDGGYHFYPSETQERFEKGRQRDIYKHYMALKNGKKMIRINCHIKNKDIEEHLDKALLSEENEYFADPTVYDWLIEGVKNFQL